MVKDDPCDGDEKGKVLVQQMNCQLIASLPSEHRLLLNKVRKKRNFEKQSVVWWLSFMVIGNPCMVDHGQLHSLCPYHPCTLSPHG